MNQHNELYFKQSTMRNKKIKNKRRTIFVKHKPTITRNKR